MVAALLSGCGRGPQQPWFGYAEGKVTFVSPAQPGWLSSLNVRRGDVVKKGQVLFTLDDTAQLAARDQTEAALSQAKNQLASLRAQLAADRSADPHLAGRAQIRQIEAQARAAKANLAAAVHQLAQRRVVARSSGEVEDIYFTVGQYVPAATPVMSLLPAKNVFVRFFVPQAQFSNVRLGERVHVTCDGCSNNLMARITFIARQQQFPPPVAFSAANRRQLVFKLEARARHGMSLHPGQSVDVTPAR